MPEAEYATIRRHAKRVPGLPALPADAGSLSEQ